MPTTFEVLYLGTAAEIDTVEGNTTAENDSSLVGLTFGSAGDPLAFGSQRTFSPVDYSVGQTDRYDIDNTSGYDTFSIDGGPPQAFDGLAVYNATITYTDGTPPANITAVVLQDTGGNLYLAPESAQNADYYAMIAAPIESLTLNSIVTITTGNLLANRADTDFICFTAGTRILTARGEIAVEQLGPGDLVVTEDHGLQPIRWTGARRVAATGSMAPILIREGALGNHRDLMVSPQHRMLLSGWQAELLFGAAEVLVAAKMLINDSTIRRVSVGEVEYHHFLFDRHQLVTADGALTESFHPGEAGLRTLSDPLRQELFQLFPELRSDLGAAGPTCRPCLKAFEAQLLVH